MERYVLPPKDIPSILYHVAYSSISCPAPLPSTVGIRAPSWLARYPRGPSFPGSHDRSLKRAMPEILTTRKLFVFEMDNHIKVSNVPQLTDMGNTHPSSFVTLLTSRQAVEREMKDRNRSSGDEWKVWKIDGRVLRKMGVKILRLQNVFAREKELVFPSMIKEARKEEFVAWSDVPANALRGVYTWSIITSGQADPFLDAITLQETQSEEQTLSDENTTLSSMTSRSDSPELLGRPNLDGSFTFEKIVHHWPKSAKGPAACTSYLIRWGPHEPNSYTAKDAMNTVDIEAYWNTKRKKGRGRKKSSGMVLNGAVMKRSIKSSVTKNIIEDVTVAAQKSATSTRPKKAVKAGLVPVKRSERLRNQCK